MKVADMHCDTILELLYSKEKDEQEMTCLNQNKLHIDLQKMKQGDYLVQNFAMFVNLKKYENALERCLLLSDIFYEEMEKNQDIIRPAKSYFDIVANQKLNKMSGILTIEEGAVIKGNLSYLRNFYRLGVRMITLTWNYINEIGYPNAITPDGNKAPFDVPNIKNGLSDFGIEMVQEMERLGMIVDVSHLSDAGFYDVLKYSRKPFVASHSNARSICRNRRNLSDDMIKKLSERGGVMGMNFEMSFLKNPESEENVIAGIGSVIEHIKHVRNIAGCECIGLGSDFDGIDQNVEIKDASYMPLLEDALWKNGFGLVEIKNIFYKNVMRVYKEVLR